MIDAERYQRLSKLVDEALDLPEEMRESFLTDACAGDAELRRQIDRMLDQVTPAGGDPGSLDFSAEFGADRELESTEIRRIGGYDILGLLGEGGMGAVYLAEQTRPVARRVALKVIHTSLRTPKLLDRFHAERNALARLAHPNVAVLHEAGATEDGFPFFAMEHLPEALALTRHCDLHQLSIDARLRLFIQACAGVQHAHQKGVLHRDLKPSNVLVSRIDGEDRAKVIDFGLAKSLDEVPLSERTQLTAGRTLGTPAYMSPEARQGGGDLDTRTDVFSLGVVLYELLVGARPLLETSSEGSGKSRPLHEHEIVRPSAQIRKASPKVLDDRRATSGALHRRLAGDLDWIVLRALARQPEDRYPSVSELAADIERHLSLVPVFARPPSRAYQMRRFFQRHRAQVMVLLAVLGLIAGLTIAFTNRLIQERDQTRLQANRASAAQAEAEEMVSFLVGLFELSGPDATLGETISARELLDRGSERIEEQLADRPVAQARLMRTIGNIYLRLGLYDRSQELIEKALKIREDHPEQLDLDIAQSLIDLAQVLTEKGRYHQAQPLIERSLTLREKVLGAENPKLAVALDELGKVRLALGDAASAEDLHRRAIDLLEAQNAPVWEPDIALGTSHLATALLVLGKYRDAKLEYADAIAATEKLLGPRHPTLAPMLNNLANVHSELGEYTAARSIFGKALEIHREALGEESSRVGLVLLNLGMIDAKLGELDEAEQKLNRSLDIFRQTFSAEHPFVAATLGSLGEVEGRRGRLHQADELLREAVAMNERTLGADHPQGAFVLTALGNVLAAQGREEEAKETLEASLAVLEKAYGKEHLSLAEPLLDLADLLARRGELEAATIRCRRAVEIRRSNLDADSMLLRVAEKKLQNLVTNL